MFVASAVPFLVLADAPSWELHLLGEPIVITTSRIGDRAE
jgi:hypothetical protein